MRLRNIVTAVALLLSVATQAQINLAGTYEGQMNDNITRKRMYANLDFINGVPDFTQVFTSKEAPLKILPKDFMNAKKLKKNFVGQTAPGFIRYNTKTIFSDTEEIKLINPQLENGILTAEWINHDGKKGKCFIIANPDNTIQILGLTVLDTDFGPDNLVLNRTESKLAPGEQPFVTSPENISLTNKRYCREALWRGKFDNSKGLSGLKPAVDINQVRRIGNDILVPVQFSNTASKEARPYFGDHNPFERNELSTVNGAPCRVFSADGNLEKSIGPKETAMQRFIIEGAPFDAQKIDVMKIKGRAQYTHSTDKNPYGDFEYKITDLVIPELQPSNRLGVFITDSDIQVNFDGVEKEGKNLIVNFTLANHSGREKKLITNDKGIARTQDGEEFQCTVKLPEVLGPDGVVKGKLTIENAASADIRMARIPINITERNLNYKVTLQF